MAKLPERVVSKEGRNRLGSQLTGQNRRSLFFLGLEMVLQSLGPVPLCVVLLVHANRSDTSDRGLGPLPTGVWDHWSQTPVKPCVGRFVRDLGPFPLCVVLLVRANRSHTSDRGLGPPAIRPVFGTSSGVDVSPADVRPVDMRPADVRPVDVRPADVRPVDVRPLPCPCVWFCLRTSP